MRVLVTGHDGFIGKNLCLRLSELLDYEIVFFGRNSTLEVLEAGVLGADVIIHLAGINRPKDPEEFIEGNVELTSHLCGFIKKTGRTIPLLIASSTQADLNNPYGKSKLAAEDVGEELAVTTNNPVLIYRLPNVFGKWCKPNYNSVVATFCHNIANDLPIVINDPNTQLRLVYVDDVVNEFIAKLGVIAPGLNRGIIEPAYSVSLGELAAQIQSFKECRSTLIVEQVGVGFVRALYATYVSYLPPNRFVYQLPKYGDERGVFVEMLKTKDSGQFSYFTAHPGVTRGGHYHHTKTEKFLVIKGSARFRFRHMLTNQTYAIETNSDNPQVVETVPGWTHDITNTGNEEMIVMLWANEIFDRERPDTIASKV